MNAIGVCRKRSIDRQARPTAPGLRRAGGAGKAAGMTQTLGRTHPQMPQDQTPQVHTMLDKTFDPAAIEAKWYAHWEANGLFQPDRPDAVPYTIVNPPPNVTGSLHVGHALDNTLQDIMIRYERLRGKDALWVVGTDHAGIATQMVVERRLEERQDKRANYTREAFVEKVWEWRHESGGAITRQLRRLGCSMDWSREQFTMSPEFSRAVTKVFVDLYNEGLIYRDKRLVNWDPHFRTAISDLEVEQREVNGHFWHFRYPLADGARQLDGRDYLVVATTRPETILGDGAVAVNAADERYRHLVGACVRLPLVDRLIPVIADDYVKIDFGSGAVKITAAHDHNDYDVAKRHPEANIPLINLMNADASMSDACPPGYRGLDRYEARAKVVADFDALGLLDHIEDHVHQVPYGDRSGVVIEPWLTDQWYVDAKTLAQPAIAAVRDGRIDIVPKSWEKTFFNWMENIQPWCVSRQLWWGHRIPAWYGDDGSIVVAQSEGEARRLANGERLTQDEDVLDTWFSSALWPFATLGWPLSSPSSLGAGDQPQTGGGVRFADSLLTRHYPNDLLISGFDILFFWDARMAMQGLHFMGDVPWKRLYLHGLVRAADGAKMSKSKGNVVDPLLLIDRFGADALRFFMAAMESQGRDVKMDERRLEGYRNFATKLWNAARFCQSNGIGASTTLAAPAATLAVNRWIVGEVVETLAAIDKALADLRFDAAANAIYHFAWDTFCDWYVELIKPVLGPPGPEEDETRAVAGWVLDQILVMLHPFMPFVTEELWAALGARETDLIVARWPAPEAVVDAEAKTDVEWLIALTGNLRAAKAELGIAPGARLDAFLPDPGERTRAIIAANASIIERVTRLSTISFAPPPAGAAMQVGVGDASLSIPLAGVIDLSAERARLTKSLATSEKERDALAKRLANTAFVEKAKPEAIDKARADHAGHAAEAERLAAALARLN